MHKGRNGRTARNGCPRQKNGNIFFRGIKGAVTGLIVTVAAVLILAFAVKTTNMSDAMISAFNQAIKIASIIAAGIAASKGAAEKFVAVGMMAGGIYVILGYLTFSLIEGQFGDVLVLMMDLGMGISIGMIISIIFGKLLQLKKKCK